jgi:hypothetical protein
VTLNLESVILIENKLFRIAQNMKHIRLPSQNSPKQVLETYENTFTDLVELCEDYWYILRIESGLFSKLPQKIFGNQDPLFVETLTKSFNLQMIVISICGFLVSN